MPDVSSLKKPPINSLALLEIEFELLIQDLKNSGLIVNENVENIDTDKTFVTFISGKKEKKEG